jgi:hypothetical protein
MASLPSLRGIAMKRSPALLALLALALPAGADVPCGPAGVTASVSPQVAALGQSIEVTLTNDSSQTITLPSGCVYQAVYCSRACEGIPPGALVYGPACITVLWPIQPGRSETMPWDQRDDENEQVPTGTYAFQIAHDSGTCNPTLTITEGIPALGRWGLSALVGCVCLAGIWALRARRAAPGSA